MINKLKTIFASAMMAATLLTPAMVPVSVHAAADLQGSLCKGAQLDVTSTANCDRSEASGATLNSLIAKVINLFSVIVGVVAVIMIIIGGFKYIMSGGDSGNVTGAKNTILYAIIGLIIVALAQVIVKFVINVAPTA